MSSSSSSSSSAIRQVSCSTSQRRAKKSCKSDSDTASQSTATSRLSDCQIAKPGVGGGQGRSSIPKSPAKCGVCSGKITDGKDEALYCEGRCKTWMHRFCAGVSKIQFEELSSNTQSSYECATCCRELQAQKITALEDTVAALKSEVSQLKSVVERLLPLSSLKDDYNSLSVLVKRICDSECTKENEKGRGLVEVASGGRHGQSSQRRETEIPTGDLRRFDAIPQRSHMRDGEDGIGLGEGRGGKGEGTGKGKGNFTRKKKKVLGARKVWGTMHTTTVHAVKNVVSSIAHIPAHQVVIKRKYKSQNVSGKVRRWWFIIRADESVLQRLDSQWAHVSLQTAWRLEEVYSYADADPSACSVSSLASQSSNTMEQSSSNSQLGSQALPSVQTQSLSLNNVPDNGKHVFTGTSVATSPKSSEASHTPPSVQALSLSLNNIPDNDNGTIASTSVSPSPTTSKASFVNSTHFSTQSSVETHTETSGTALVVTNSSCSCDESERNTTDAVQNDLASTHNSPSQNLTDSFLL